MQKLWSEIRALTPADRRASAEATDAVADAIQGGGHGDVVVGAFSIVEEDARAEIVGDDAGDLPLDLALPHGAWIEHRRELGRDCTTVSMRVRRARDLRRPGLALVAAGLAVAAAAAVSWLARLAERGRLWFW